MDAQVLLEAAAVYGCIVTQVALVGLDTGVAAHVHGQVVLAAEALITELTLVWLVPFKHRGREDIILAAKLMGTHGGRGVGLTSAAAPELG